MLLSVFKNASELMDSGQVRAAIDVLLAERQRVRRVPMACDMLAFMLLQADRPEDAIEWFEASLGINPADLKALGGLGMALLTAGKHQRSLQCYEQMISLNPGNSEGWFRGGVVLAELGRFDEALENLDRAIALNDQLAPAMIKKSEILEGLGDMQGAIAAALAACKLAQVQSSSWFRLAELMQKSGWNDQAIMAYDRGLQLAPEDFLGLHNKALALKASKLNEQALVSAQAALRVEPTNKEALLLCGNLELALGNSEAAHFCFREVARMGIVRSYPAGRKPAKFRALMLFSPVAGNTPYEDLIQDGCFDADMIIVLPGQGYDPAFLDGAADVIVNLVSEPDLGPDAILQAAHLVEGLETPIVNHPKLILGTDREAIARRLAGMPDVSMPMTVHVSSSALLARLERGDLPSFPLIIRHAGTHGGDMMELVSDAETLRSFAEEARSHDLYLTDFVDYSSADGYFRKYRFVFVGDEILPYHLAIGDVWKVHHASTRMGDVEWMRGEEEAFLNAPDKVFGADAMAALDAIRRRIGLDYFGIDCSIDRDGNVLVFEVNASMLIHLHNEGFEYKTPHVNRIRSAFETMLERRVGERSQQAIQAQRVGTGTSPR
ncbi:tetratricopeptide repeat protein [Rhizobium sp. XQZ8]|uniref:tetratricopeptide repeat protein n=1 Tax=Rhizobium populisoli TaxID=2859785 RepID=UPI001CA533E4|nr:tetratricopeptide repeat protein [Rhizobium populisoli]MBW6423829.1 tetratricopeptide repeat protein [Rhizobium populisoli]